ncbi:MAG: DUF4209 domain-containing protein [Sphingobacterium sp.]|nr:DUF4209 domain-containing protein [Sphingobacterium sp.]
MERIQECTSTLMPENFDWDKSSEELRFLVSLEFNAFSYFKKEDILTVFGKKKIVAIEYLQERITTVNNDLLKGKYYHLLFFFTNNNKTIFNAIDSYNLALEICLNDHKDNARHIRFQDILDLIIELSKTFKYKIDELKAKLIAYLDTEIYDRLKTWIIDSLVKSKLFKPLELKGIPTLCLTIASREKEQRFIEINLLLALNISTKLQNQALIEKINELLGDNEYTEIKQYDGTSDQMAIPHQNNHTYIKIIQYYKKSKNKRKINEAILAYNTNKEKCTFVKFSGASIINDKLTDKKVEEAISIISNQHPKQIISDLVWGDILPFYTNDIIDDYVDRSKDSMMLKLMKPMSHDINNNQHETIATDYLKYNLYAERVPFTAAYVHSILLSAIANRKISCSKCTRILSSDLFLGIPLSVTRNGVKIEYTWLEMIKVGLKDFFDQCNLILKDKAPNWTITLDILSLKFEGILRDIIGLVDGVITKIDKNGNSVDLLLDDLLRSEVIGKIFTKDDINLFQYTFTNKGLNIRNNIAHSFYKPQDYTAQKVIMVLLCVLRLAKFRYIWTKNKKSSVTI